MLKKRILSSLRPASERPARRTLAVAHWRVWTAILTAITFAVLVSTAVMHHHATAVEDQDCAICSVVTHKLTDLPLVHLPKLVVILVWYAPYLSATPRLAPSFPLPLPPSCGPPVLSSAIC